MGTITTLVVALLLYDRFKIGQNILDKQGQAVLNLLHAIRKMSFEIKSGSLRSMVHFSIINEPMTKAIIDCYARNCILLVDFSFFDYIGNALDLASDIYIPNEIATMVFQTHFSLQILDRQDGICYVYIKPYNWSKEVKEKSEDLSVLADSDGHLYLNDFVEIWRGRITALENWIKRNAPTAAKSLGLASGK